MLRLVATYRSAAQKCAYYALCQPKKLYQACMSPRAMCLPQSLRVTDSQAASRMKMAYSQPSHPPTHYGACCTTSPSAAVGCPVLQLCFRRQSCRRFLSSPLRVAQASEGRLWNSCQPRESRRSYVAARMASRLGPHGLTAVSSEYACALIPIICCCA